MGLALHAIRHGRLRVATRHVVTGIGTMLWRPPGAGSPAGSRDVLFIDRTIPDPTLDSGSVRLLEIMRILAEAGYRITLVPDSAITHERSMAIAGVPFEVESLSNLPRWLCRHRHTLSLVWLSRFQTVAKHAELVRYLAPDSRIVFDTVDLHFLREGRRLALAGDPNAEAQASQILAKELAAVDTADATVLVSKHEEELLRVHRPSAHLTVVSNIHSPQRSEIPGFDGRAGLVFMGGTQHLPNRDAIQWLSRSLLPNIRQLNPHLEAHVVGAIQPNERIEFATPGLKFHGRVPDLAPILDSSLAAIAPLRSGAGVKGKINTAMARGLPVIATSMAIEGMGLTPNQDVLVADTPGAFAEATRRLASDADLWGRLSRGGLENIRNRYSPEIAAQAIKGLIP